MECTILANHWRNSFGQKATVGLRVVDGVLHCMTQLTKDVLAIDDFQRFLDLAEVSKILPKWWAFEDRMETLGLAIDKGDLESIFKPINQTELPQRYGGDMAIRQALAILAELVVGYDGKGPAADDTWFREFQEFLDLHPEERARLIKGSIDMVNSVLEEHGKDFGQNPT